MAYQRTGTPRFFIDLPTFARHHGIVNLAESLDRGGLFSLNPSKTKTFQLNATDGMGDAWIELNESRWLNSLQYVFILGHKFFTESTSVALILSLPGVGDETIAPTYTINCAMVEGLGITPDKDGWCMVEFRKDLTQNIPPIDLDITPYPGWTRLKLSFTGTGGSDLSLGDTSIGWTYEMPHSPDLSIKLGYINESIKTQTTKGGHTLTNSGWSEPPYWLNKPQWMTKDGYTPIGSYKGFNPSARRTWDLSFSYLDDTDMLKRDYTGDTRIEHGVFAGKGFPDQDFSTIGIADTFYTKVVHGTANFKLPFIFQPNKDVDEFAICRINSDSFTLEQVANNVYNVSMTITETW